ncbi:hypothetical protein [Microbacterium maritypicum]|uniref:Uncharacterized protein n=1 Tax=Microbacterium maritypicum TaxID=33918 RepID=A0A4Y4B444_MICMQ|nr:hypothetical protein [Microbacterium liquefaciens]GEC74000.1 hypothetical protein MLI01_01450 [Microbacterium liquefaciens]GGV48616.1 hypothetical protein GCM10010213_01460 [Microbacterium liquefaciens]
MTDTASTITLITTARRDLLAAALLQDQHLTPEGLRARQRRDVDVIRARLTAALPAEPTTPDRQPVLDALAPKDADMIALQAHQWSKVRALLDAGRDLPSIIQDADRLRLAAILDHLGTMPEVLEDSRPEEVVEFIQGAVWDRLVQVDPAAERIAAIERTNQPAIAWRAILEGLAATGEVRFEGRVLLHQVDPEALALLDEGDALAAPAPESGVIPRLVESLESVPA